MPDFLQVWRIPRSGIPPGTLSTTGKTGGKRGKKGGKRGGNGETWGEGTGGKQRGNGAEMGKLRGRWGGMGQKWGESGGKRGKNEKNGGGERGTHREKRGKTGGNWEKQGKNRGKQGRVGPGPGVTRIDKDCRRVQPGAALEAPRRRTAPWCLQSCIVSREDVADVFAEPTRSSIVAGRMPEGVSPKTFEALCLPASTTVIVDDSPQGWPGWAYLGIVPIAGPCSPTCFHNGALPRPLCVGAHPHAVRAVREWRGVAGPVCSALFGPPPPLSC